MGWADFYIEKLKEGHSVTFKPRGNSMSGIIESGQQVTCDPVTIEDLSIGDVVLCAVKGNQYLHIVKAKDGDRVLMGNAHGYTNGWTNKVYGRWIS